MSLLITLSLLSLDLLFLLKLLLLQEVENAAFHLGISLTCALERGFPTAPTSKKLQIQKVIQKSLIVKQPASPMTSSLGLSVRHVKKEREVHEEGEETLQETSTEGSKAKCSICLKSYRNKYYVNRHIKRKHENDFKLSEPFANIKNDKLETDINMSGKKYKCNKCNRRFLTGKKLKKHMKSHSVTGSGEHECEVCQKRFPSSSSLILHRNIHLEEKPFNCDDCDKGFNQKGNLKSHIQKYHGKELSDVLSESLNDVFVSEAETMEVEVDFPVAVEQELVVDDIKNREIIGGIVSEVLK